MQVRELSVHNFRCFDTASLSFERPVVLIEGANGVGKTALLEALHYACYLKSFRTHVPREMIKFGKDHFTVQLHLRDTDGVSHEVRVGCAQRKRSVRVDGRSIASYKELLAHVRVVSLTDSDMQLIRGGPDVRRGFIDQYVFIHDPDFLKILRAYDMVVAQRNALLARGGDEVSRDIWTRRLWLQATAIVAARKTYLQRLERDINTLSGRVGLTEGAVRLVYAPKKELGGSFEAFMDEQIGLGLAEARVRHSLFGAHLDDVLVLFSGSQARSFASRGQQKLLALLFRVAQVLELTSLYGSCIFVLDDFMLDFDEERLDILLNLLGSLNCQLIFTSAHVHDSVLARGLGRFGVQRIHLPGGLGDGVAKDSPC